MKAFLLATFPWVLFTSLSKLAWAWIQRARLNVPDSGCYQGVLLMIHRDELVAGASGWSQLPEPVAGASGGASGRSQWPEPVAGANGQSQSPEPVVGASCQSQILEPVTGA